MNDLELRNFTIGNNRAMTLMGGVNVLESRDLAMQVGEKFKSISDELGINYIFKGSFDKANRSSVSSFRGPGLDEGLKILQEVSTEFNVAVVTDIHEPSQAMPVSEVCEIVQIPAFLARQTDLVVAAAKTSSTPSANAARCKQCSIIVIPSILHKGLPGNRVDPNLAGMPTYILSFFIIILSLRVSWLL